MIDPIADLIIRIKNASKAHLQSIKFNSSNLTNSIVDVLKRQGYIDDYKVLVDNKRKSTIVNLKYKNSISPINGIRQISKPGLRVYQESKKLPYVLNGLGIAIISTSKGLMTDQEARKLKIGGEILLYVW